MDEITAKTAKEVVNVLYKSDMNIFMKIPPKFISFLEVKASECKDEVVINKKIGINNQLISDEAKAILAIIYKDFLVDQNQKEIMEKELKERYEEDEVERKTNHSEEKETSTELVVYKEKSKLGRILDFIKKFFSKSS